mgnify:FL=1
MIYPNKKYIEKLTGCNIIALKETPSTNDLAKKAAQNGAPDGTTYIAKIQTGGHGRGDKHFFCYDGGVYLSVIIRNSLLPAELITSAAAAAVCRAIRAATCAPVSIKWINDLYLSDKKVCGILALRAGDAYVVGIGINVKETIFPDDLRRTAAAICSDTDLNSLAADIINRLRLAVNESAESIIKYCTDNSYTIGKEITYEKNGKTFVGMADKLFPDGTLGVKLSDGNYDVLNSGEISVKTEKKS